MNVGAAISRPCSGVFRIRIQFRQIRRIVPFYYVSTGSGILKKQFGFEYVKALVGEFFHIQDVEGFFAEKLDLIGSDPERIMRDAIAEIDSASF